MADWWIARADVRLTFVPPDDSGFRGEGFERAGISDVLVEAPVDRGILMHSYSGSHELVKLYLRYGCSFSFAGPVSFLEARKPLEAVRAVPLERLMAETDAPDQAPHPHRGGRSEPAFVPLIIDAMAAARGEPAELVRRATTENAARFFALAGLT